MAAVFVAFAAAIMPLAQAQNPSAPNVPSSMMDRLNAMISGGKSAWSPEQLSTMERIRDVSMNDRYAFDELRHLSNNIGPRLSGSPQAQQAVDYVAAEMRALGDDVTLEKATVPHWLRGEEKAELVSCPGQTPSTTQKIVLTALGGSVSTPPEASPQRLL